MNWYRTTLTNYIDDLSLHPSTLTHTHILEPPVLMITATHDDAVLPSFAKRMGNYVTHLTLREVPTGHWALWEGASEVNELLEEWIGKVVFGGEKSLGVPPGYGGSKL